jgi:hypothetical protein
LGQKRTAEATSGKARGREGGSSRNFEAVAVFEMLTQYRDNPEEFLGETIALRELGLL